MKLPSNINLLLLTALVLSLINVKLSLGPSQPNPDNYEIVFQKKQHAFYSCNEQRTGRLVKRNQSNYGSQSMSEYLEGLGLKRSQELSPPLNNDTKGDSICLAFEDVDRQHFAHAMQDFLACWSWWMIHPHQNRVIAASEEIQKRQNNSKSRMYMDGVMTSTNVHWRNITTLSNHENKTAVQARKRPFFIFSLGAVANLKETVMKTNNIEAKSCIGDTPRIGLLNRQESRSIQNAQKLVGTIRDQFGINTTLAYFEGTTFKEQINYFASHDLVLSGHGAQLTSMYALPYCGAVMELFPMGYYMPWYFGSLADGAGLSHYSLYANASDNFVNDTEVMSRTGADRKGARNAQFCPAAVDIAHAVQQMISDWRKCCNSVNHDS